MKKLILTLICAVALCISSVGISQAGQPTFYFDIIVSSSVTDLGGDMWLYEYILSGGPVPGDNYRMKDLSHWWIELPEEKIATLSMFDPFTNQTYFNEPSGAADGFDGFHWGVKWDSDQLITYSFKSTHGPVVDGDGKVVEDAYDWFAKSGGDFYDFGKALGPNGHGGHDPVVPEPASMILLGSGLLGAGILKKRKI